MPTHARAIYEYHTPRRKEEKGGEGGRRRTATLNEPVCRQKQRSGRRNPGAPACTCAHAAHVGRAHTPLAFLHVAPFLSSFISCPFLSYELRPSPPRALKDCTVQRPRGTRGTGIQTSDIDSGGAMLSPPEIRLLQQQRKLAPSRSTDSRNDRRTNWAQSLTLRATVFSLLFRACAVDCCHVGLRSFRSKQVKQSLNNVPTRCPLVHKLEFVEAFLVAAALCNL